MRILFFNQYGPGDSSPTARLLEDLAGRLKEKGWVVDWATAGNLYGKRKTGWRRWLDEAWVHLGLIRKGFGCSRPDIVLSLTSPACLAATASFVSVLRGVRHIHWLMDLYPDLALALGEIRPGPAARLVRAIMRKAYRSCAQVVTLDSDMQSHLFTCYGISSVVIRPWPALTPHFDTGRVFDKKEGTEWTWLYSGNLGRAHEWETLLRVQALLEMESVPACLVFQGDGSGFEPARSMAKQLCLQRCYFRSYVAREALTESLLEAAVVIATRKPEVKGLLWPSKLALLEGLPRPLLWVGDTNGDLASRLRTREKTGVFLPGQVGEIKAWLLKIAVDASPFEKPLRDAAGQYSESLHLWEKLLGAGIQGEDLALVERAVE